MSEGPFANPGRNNPHPQFPGGHPAFPAFRGTRASATGTSTLTTPAPTGSQCRTSSGTWRSRLAPTPVRVAGSA